MTTGLTTMVVSPFVMTSRHACRGDDVASGGLGVGAELVRLLDQRRAATSGSTPGISATISTARPKPVSVLPNVTVAVTSDSLTSTPALRPMAFRAPEKQAA